MSATTTRPACARPGVTCSPGLLRANVTVTSARTASSATAPVSGSTPVVLPFFTGERSTGWAGGARAVFAGVSASSTGADLARGVLEGVAVSYARVAEQLEDAAGGVDRVVASGSASQDVPEIGRAHV